jgi:hypothetical protein
MVIHRWLSSTQLWQELGTTIVTNNDQKNKLYSDGSHIVRHSIPIHGVPTISQPPLADYVLLEHRRALMYSLLPYLDPDILRTDPNAYRVASYIGHVVDEMPLTRQDTNKRAESTRAPKTPSQYFTEIGCN